MPSKKQQQQEELRPLLEAALHELQEEVNAIGGANKDGTTTVITPTKADQK